MGSANFCDQRRGGSGVLIQLLFVGGGYVRVGASSLVDLG
jgi:hypothetical protein